MRTLLTFGIAAALLQAPQTITLRGRQQALRVYGPSTGDPIVVSSGDGGWIHLGPHIADVLARRGFFVVGFNVKAYLESFTSGKTTLDPALEPEDYAALAEFASRGSAKAPILIGVSEGAGLSLLAATNPRTRALVSGVIGVGLPNVNELGWRWADAAIYLTHRVPNEPTFSTAAIAANVAPLPLAAIHSTRDEFVPLADVQRIMNNARDPKKLWVVDAVDHRFSNNLPEFETRLFEAIAWIRQHPVR
jgi:alpha-beta hydrolase superfamily lysophospholipase